MSAPRVASLHIYPVKSCRGIDVDSALVTGTGLEWDRRWMIVDANDRFITQRSHTKLATVTTAIADGELRLTTAGRKPLVVAGKHDGKRRSVVIWKDVCTGIDAGDEAAGWFSELLGEPLRLVRIDEDAPRHTDPYWVGENTAPTTFTDGYPFLMISRASLAELNRRLPAPIPMNRFRPNVVIDGVPAHAEDAMSLFDFGEVVLRGVKLCTRCATTTTDQFTGRLDPDQQPLRTLRTYRHDRSLKGLTFGQNCVIHSGAGSRLAVGAALTIG